MEEKLKQVEDTKLDQMTEKQNEVEELCNAYTEMEEQHAKQI